jgi:hypothetical protein
MKYILQYPHKSIELTCNTSDWYQSKGYTGCYRRVSDVFSGHNVQSAHTQFPIYSQDIQHVHSQFLIYCQDIWGVHTAPNLFSGYTGCSQGVPILRAYRAGRSYGVPNLFSEYTACSQTVPNLSGYMERSHSS